MAKKETTEIKREVYDRVSLSGLQGMRECPEKLKNSELHLSDPKIKAMALHTVWLPWVKKELLSGSEVRSICDRIGEFLTENVEDALFDSPVVKKKLLSQEMKRATRLLLKMEELGYKVVDTDVSFDLLFKPHLVFGEIEVTGIHDRIDFICRDSYDILHAVKVMKNVPYSNKARKDENKPSASIELLAYRAALMEQYPEVVPELFALKTQRDGHGEVDLDLDKYGPVFVSDTKVGKGKEATVIPAWYGYNNVHDHLVGIKNIINNMPAEKQKCYDCPAKGWCMPNRCEAVNHTPMASAPRKLLHSEVQEAIVEHEDGPIAVIAGPGSGKTNTTCRRVESLICECGVEPERILCLSWSNKAAQELTDRIAKIYSGEGTVESRTIDSFISQLVRENPQAFGRRLKILTDADKKLLIFNLINEVEIEGFSFNDVKGEYGLVNTLLRHVNEIEKEGVEAFRLANGKKTEEYIDTCIRMFEAVCKFKAENGLISYDEQTKLCLKMLKSNEALANKIASKYDFIMIDEYQDINDTQADIFDLLASYIDDNIMVVGDANQQINQWRGASSDRLINFKKYHPDAEVYEMYENHRSSASIVAGANHIITNGDSATSLCNNTTREGEGQKTKYYYNGSLEALPGLVNGYKEAGYNYKDIAVLVRSNKTGKDIGEVMSANGIKCSSPKDYLTADPVFVAIFDLLSIAYEPQVNDIPLYRLMVQCGLTKADLVRYDLRYNESLYSYLIRSGYIYPFITDAKLCDEEWNAISEEEADEASLPYLLAGQKVFKALKVVFNEDLGLLNQLAKLPRIILGNLGKSEGVVGDILALCDKNNIENLHDLYRVMKTLTELNDSSRVIYDVSDDVLNVLTAHDSKGKEFPVVIIYGVGDFSVDKDGAERNLLYVAMTRAKNELAIIQTGDPIWFDEFSDSSLFALEDLCS